MAKKKQIIGGPLEIGGRILSLSRAIRAGDFVYLTGQIPMQNGAPMTTGTVEEQTRAVLDDITAPLTMHKAPDGTAYTLIGPADGPVVVMIHGLGLNRDCWQWTTPALNDHYRVLCYDLYGHGQSTPPHETPSLSLFSNQLATLLDHCGIETATLAGFSLGGMIVRRFAQDHAHRTTGLVILHSPHKRSADAQDAILKRVEQARVLSR